VRLGIGREEVDIWDAFLSLDLKGKTYTSAVKEGDWKLPPKDG